MKTRRSVQPHPSAAPTASVSSPAADTSNQAAIEQLGQVAGREPEEGFLHRLGESIGMGAGVVVTELLDLVPGWNAPLQGEDGAEVQSVDGAQRIGDHAIEKRHTKVVGPQIASYAAKLDPGWWRDFVSGVGDGASDAPGASYRLEAAVSDHIDDHWGR